MNQFFTSGGQSIRVSASASVLLMNIQDWYLLGWNGWISLQSKGLSRVFSSTTVQKHQFFGAQLLSYTFWTFITNLNLYVFSINGILQETFFLILVLKLQVLLLFDLDTNVYCRKSYVIECGRKMLWHIKYKTLEVDVVYNWYLSTTISIRLVNYDMLHGYKRYSISQLSQKKMYLWCYGDLTQ